MTYKGPYFYDAPTNTWKARGRPTLTYPPVGWPTNPATGPANHRLSDSGVINIGTGVYDIGPDWNFPSAYPRYAALASSATAIKGNGSKLTTIRPYLNSMSVASAALIPAQPPPGLTATVNPLWSLRADKADMSGFRFLATQQSVNGVDMLYNGIETYHRVGGTHNDVFIQGVPGNNAANPGETFSWSEFHTDGTTATNMEISGLNESGVRVSASALGYNFGTGNHAWTDCSFHDMGYGAGITHYQCQGVYEYLRVSSYNNFVPFNHEQCSNITLNYRQCNFGPSHRDVKAGNGFNVHMIVDSPLGSAKINIHDPVFTDYSWTSTSTNFWGGGVNQAVPGKFIVLVHSNYNGQAQLQLPSDIKIFKKGVDVTASTLQVVSGPG